MVPIACVEEELPVGEDAGGGVEAAAEREQSNVSGRAVCSKRQV